VAEGRRVLHAAGGEAWAGVVGRAVVGDGMWSVSGRASTVACGWGICNFFEWRHCAQHGEREGNKSGITFF
jgi:hypothetical protein